jgi:hypothetical protein
VLGYVGQSSLHKRRSTRKQPCVVKMNWPLLPACHAGRLADHQTPVGSAPRHILWDADKKSQRPTFLVSFTFTVLFFSPQVSRKRLVGRVLAT